MDDVEDALDVVLSEGSGQLGKVVTKEIPEVGTLTFVYAKDPEGNIIESLRVIFPAARGEFVIPAKAGIQKTILDSVSSTE